MTNLAESLDAKTFADGQRRFDTAARALLSADWDTWPEQPMYSLPSSASRRSRLCAPNFRRLHSTSIPGCLTGSRKRRHSRGVSKCNCLWVRESVQRFYSRCGNGLPRPTPASEWAFSWISSG